MDLSAEKKECLSRYLTQQRLHKMASALLRKIFFKKLNLKLIFFSVTCIVIYRNGLGSYGPDNAVRESTKLDDASPRKLHYWNAVVRKSPGHYCAVLPDIFRNGKQIAGESSQLDVRQLVRKLWRHQSKASFMDLPVSLIPPYSEIRCRPDLGLRIPNIVHYVWFGSLEMKLHQYLSLRSAASIQQPFKIYLHLDMETIPTGKYWERLKREVPCLEVQRHVPPEKIYGHRLEHVAHKSDIIRLQTLLSVGGIYLDINAYFINHMDPLMNNSFVIGKEEIGCYGNSVMLAEPGAPFLKLWMENYRTFRPWMWNEHSTHLPVRLHESYPDIEIFVDKFSMMRPNYRDGIEWMLTKNWDLTDNYCVHLYENTFELEFAPIFVMPESEVIAIDSTFGQIARRALFGKFYLSDDQRRAHRSASKLLCFELNIQKALTGTPNVLHFVWGGRNFTHHNYISIRSSVLIFRPSSVVFHIIGTEEEEEEPFHHLWVRLNHEIPCIMINRLPREFSVLHSPHDHRSDLKVKLVIAMFFGGIVWDLDTIALRPFVENLNEYSAIVAMMDSPLSDLIIMGERNSTFFRNWIDLLESQPSERPELKSLHGRKIPSRIKELKITLEMATESWFLDDAEVTTGDSVSAYYFDHGLIAKHDQSEAFTLRQNTTYGRIARKITFGDDLF